MENNFVLVRLLKFAVSQIYQEIKINTMIRVSFAGSKIKIGYLK